MDSSALTVPQLLSTLWRGRYLLAFLAISAALIGLYLTTSMPKKYTAEGLLVIEPREVVINELGVAPWHLSVQDHAPELGKRQA